MCLVKEYIWLSVARPKLVVGTKIRKAESY